MKNYLKMTLIAAMAIPMLFSLSSCTPEHKDEEPPKEEKTYKGSFELTYKASADLLAVADIKISYNDETGKLVTEAVTTTAKWTKKVVYKKLPVTVGFKIAYTVKNPLPTDKPSFDLEYLYDGSVYSLDAKTNEVIGDGINPYSHEIRPVKTEHVGINLETFNVSKSFLIDSKGVKEI
ncbi:MAG: hypothetical protein RSH25_15810 [Bacteroides sp.]|uniref:hypothetical protein n=1 Tax=Bacteroides sp. TaxID=29523 RepID=UPI002FCC332C